jgi:hypothetical protein
MHLQIALALSSQLVPAGEFSDNARFTQMAIDSAPVEIRNEASARLQFFFLANPSESYTIQITDSRSENLHVVVANA